MMLRVSHRGIHATGLLLFQAWQRSSLLLLMIRKKIDCYVHYASVGEDKDKRNYVVSYKKIENLGYKTSITVEEGIEELIRSLQVVQTKMCYTNV